MTDLGFWLPSLLHTVQEWGIFSSNLLLPLLLLLLLKPTPKPKTGNKMPSHRHSSQLLCFLYLLRHQNQASSWLDDFFCWLSEAHSGDLRSASLHLAAPSWRSAGGGCSGPLRWRVVTVWWCCPRLLFYPPWTPFSCQALSTRGSWWNEISPWPCLPFEGGLPSCWWWWPSDARCPHELWNKTSYDSFTDKHKTWHNSSLSDNKYETLEHFSLTSTCYFLWKSESRS